MCPRTIRSAQDESVVHVLQVVRRRKARCCWSAGCAADPDHALCSCQAPRWSRPPS